MPERPTRRRSRALWIRETPSRELHGIAGSFFRQMQARDLSRAQEWLFDQVCAELEYRRRKTRPIWRCCSCQFCVPPF